MSGEHTPMTKTSWVKVIIGLITVPTLGWMLLEMWKRTEAYQDETAAIKADIKLLQNDETQWATLAQTYKEVQDMKIKVGIVMWLLEHGKIKDVEKSTDIPLKIPFILEESKKPIISPPKSPRVNEADIETFRKTMQQKYPSAKK